MQTALKTKIGPFLVISSVLAVWTLLAAQHVRAHTTNLTNPSCSGLPADTFLAAANTAGIDQSNAGTVLTATTPKQGTDLTDEGDRDFFYAKITVPPLTAGELRVFDTGAGPSDAVLCHGSSPRVTSRATYRSHDQSSAVTSATNAADAAGEAQVAADAAADTAAGVSGTDAELNSARSTASSALSTARSRLSSAASALDAAARALRNTANAALTTAAKDAAGAAARRAELAAQVARTAHADNTGTPPSNPSAQQRLDAVVAALRAVADALSGSPGTADAPGPAEQELDQAAMTLGEAAGIGHSSFKIRADVQPGDISYILVASANAAPTLAVAFHGAISTNGSLSGAASAGNQSSTEILVTAPGLLTLETTGTTDTMGALDNNDGVEIAHADSGGSGGNFKLYAPVTADTDAYTLYVEGQTDTTSIDYGLEMDFQVAMGQIASVTEGAATLAAGPDWGALALADDTFGSPAIQERSDTDYFVFTIGENTAGLLTVQAGDGATSPASDTTGTLYGPPGVEIASATDGNGRHFRVRAPAQAMDTYAVEVDGTVGSYMLTVRLDAVEGTNGAALPVTGSTNEMADGNCNPDSSFQICPPTGRNPAEREHHLLEVTQAGALYIHSTGGTDTIGTLFGPDGSQLATDDNSGQGNNFRLAVQVTPGLYLLEVRGKDANTRGAYELVTNFVAGADPTDPTDPTTPTTPGTGDDVEALRARIAQLENELDECREPVATDARGSLDNPSGAEAFRSGIGVISGWVCAAEEVTVEILRGGVVRKPSPPRMVRAGPIRSGAVVTGRKIPGLA